MKATIILILILSLFTSCSKTDVVTETPALPVEKTVETVAVAVQMPQRGAIENYTTISGSVVAKTSYDIMAENTGKVRDTAVEVGDVVEKDQVIAQIDPSKPGMNYMATPMKAAGSGTVTELYIRDGFTVAPGASLGKITDLSDLKISLSIPEQYVTRVKVGDSVSVTMESYKGETFSGKISFLSPVLDKQSRTRKAEITLDTDKELIVGMSARVRILVDKRDNVLTISKNCLIEEDGSKYVYIVEDGIAKRRDVETGLYDSERIEIISGLKDGDMVVEKGQQLLSDGVRVTL